MATTISVIGLLLAAIIFVVAIWKGLDVFTSTILVSFIIILTSWMDWWTSLSSYAEGYVGFIQNNVFVLVIGAVFGELMAASGCAESIANVVTEKMGAKRVILSIALITTVFVYVGVSGFVVLFVLAPIATIMMKQAGYPYRMIPGIIFIGATCSAMIPYAINITNIMPAQYLGTSMGSAPILGWVAFVVSFAVGYFYMVHAAKKAAIKEGTAIDESQPVKIQPTRDDLPSFWVALIPFILVVVLVLALSNLTDMNTNAIVVLSMFVGSVVIVLFCHKQVGSVAKILEKGVNNGIGATVMAAAILGFSGVLQSGIPVHYQLCNGSEDEPVSDRVLRTEYPCRYPWKRNLFHRHVL
jgi:H+/gluconate symporter-like permease